MTMLDAQAINLHYGAAQALRGVSLQAEVGEVTCDCDVLTVPGCDIRLVVYTVAAGSAGAACEAPATASAASR